ncbi:MAG TPA: type I DNA topoisomerase, partial [Bacteroidales bacterium]|nr:type I DNA topoisomerase [Bacteroidales bacterium]
GKDYVVKSSFGHVRDLTKKELGVDIEKKFEPHYEVSADKKKVVAELKKLVKTSKTIWLASDEDREGEAIAWHLFEVLGLQKKNTKRIVFHEITKTAILHAIESYRDIDMNLVDAQQARRILDRIVGFELSPVLWRKVKPSLSAGRVQSVSVRIIVEREREILNFTSQSSFRIDAEFLVDIANKQHHVQAELSKKFATKQEAETFLEACKNAQFFVNSVEKKPASKSPPAPFTTSTLQQEASRKLGFSVSKTMLVAQRLYEAGHVTYMRTDSVNLSDLAINTTKELIVTQFGNEYSKVRKFKSKIKGAQEAHEAIRPTYVQNVKISSNADEQRLYDLIRKRTIASQMSDAQLEKTVVLINIKGVEDVNFIVKGEVIVFDGFLKMYIESTDDETDEEHTASLPPLSKNMQLHVSTIRATEKFTSHPPRYTEASLVRKLEELGIGRPSTYAPTISTIQKRGYVIKEDRVGGQRISQLLTLSNNKIIASQHKENFGAEKAKLFPTDIGMVVNDFLVKNFEQILDYNFTANVEKQFDEIAEGKSNWRQMISSFYKPFHETVEKTIETSERGDGERVLGTDPDTGKQVSVRIGRFGPMVQLGTAEDDEKPTFVSLSKGQLLETITLNEALSALKQGNDGKFIGVDTKTGKNLYAKVGRFGPFVQLGESTDEDKRYAGLLKGQTVETITVEQAIDLLKLPRELGEFEGHVVSVNIGRFGPYIAHNKTFTSLKKADPDVFEITLEHAISCIVAKRENDAKKTIAVFPENPKIKVVYDRWGHPSVFYKRKYHRIAKDVDATKLTLDDCYKIVGGK